MTPYEFSLAVEGFNQAQRDAQRMLAWHAANVMNMWSKRRITTDALLGERRSFVSAEEFREHMRERLARARSQEAAE